MSKITEEIDLSHSSQEAPSGSAPRTSSGSGSGSRSGSGSASGSGLGSSSRSGSGSSSGGPQQKRQKVSQGIERMKLRFSLFGTEPVANTGREKAARDYAQSLDDKNLEIFTKLLANAIKRLLASSKQAPRVDGQSTIPTIILPLLPLAGNATISAVVDLLQPMLRSAGIEPNLSSFDGNLIFDVVKYFLPRACTIPNAEANRLLNDFANNSLGIVLISPALPGSDSSKTVTGRLLDSLIDALHVLFTHFREVLTEEDYPKRDIPENLVVLNVVGHCAGRGGVRTLPKLITSSTVQPTLSQVDPLTEEIAAVKVETVSNADEQVMNLGHDLLRIVIDTKDEVFRLDENSTGQPENIFEPRIIPRSGTSTTSSSSIHAGGSSDQSRSSSSFAQPSSKSKTGTDAEHSQRLNHNKAICASACLAVEQFRAENPNFPLFYASKRLKDSDGNLSTIAAMEARGKLVHPSVTKRTQGAFDLLILTCLRVNGLSSESILKGLGVDSTAINTTFSIDRASSAVQKLLAVVKQKTRTHVRVKRVETSPSDSRVTSVSFPEANIFTPCRKDVEIVLASYLQPSAAGGSMTEEETRLPKSFNNNDELLIGIVMNWWNQKEAKKASDVQEPWTPQHTADVLSAWGGVKHAVDNLRISSTAVFSLSEGNRFRSMSALVLAKLRGILSQQGDNRKPFATPTELDDMFSSIRADPKVIAAVPGCNFVPTLKEVREAHQYWGRYGDGTKTARRRAGDSMKTIISIQNPLRQELARVRDYVRLSSPMTAQEVLQLKDATLFALNKHAGTNDKELSVDMSRDVVLWANSKGRGAGAEYLGALLTGV